MQSVFLVWDVSCVDRTTTGFDREAARLTVAAHRVPFLAALPASTHARSHAPTPWLYPCTRPYYPHHSVMYKGLWISATL